MSRLVVVSNRVTHPREARAGGLAAAIRSALAESGGLWFGWSGQLVAAAQRELHRESVDAIDYALLDLTRDEYERYYLGFSNRTLWPLLHFQPTLMQYSRAEYAGYRAANRLFAEHLAPLLRSDDRVWVQDYHLIALATELRALGVGARIGFFFHIPVPPPDVLVKLPCHADLLAALLAYDLVGVQIKAHAEALLQYFPAKLGAQHAGGTVTIGDRHMRIAAFPISIDTAALAREAQTAVRKPPFRKLRASMNGHKLAIGVDRLDYSKGIPQRLTAFGRFLSQHSEWCSRVSLLQIAPPSRKEVPEYRELRLELEQLVGAINGRFAAPDWVPVRYVNRSFVQPTLMGFYRMAHLALVTSLHDGMNLVAKEFIAAQDPEDPGALLLSRFAGAAQELPQAILVHPYDIDDIVEGIERGLSMPAAERRERWAAMFDFLSIHDIAAWKRAFLDALERECAAPPETPPELPMPTLG